MRRRMVGGSKYLPPLSYRSDRKRDADILFFVVCVGHIEARETTREAGWIGFSKKRLRDRLVRSRRMTTKLSCSCKFDSRIKSA